MKGDTTGALGLITPSPTVTWQAGVVPVGGTYDQVRLRSLGTAPCLIRVALYLGAEDTAGVPNGWPAGAPVAEASIDVAGVQADNVAAISVELAAGQMVWVWFAADTANRGQMWKNSDPYKIPSEPRPVGAHPHGFANPQEASGRSLLDAAPTLAASGFDLITNGNGVEGNGFSIIWRLAS